MIYDVLCNRDVYPPYKPVSIENHLQMYTIVNYFMYSILVRENPRDASDTMWTQNLEVYGEVALSCECCQLAVFDCHQVG